MGLCAVPSEARPTTITRSARPSFGRQQRLSRGQKSRHIARDIPGVSADLIVEKPSEEKQEELIADGRCKTCGVPQSDIPRGCNQEGRVAGGIGAIAGFDWWPIKAYRPCGKAAKAGVLYTRKGQITDEVLFGPRQEKKR